LVIEVVKDANNAFTRLQQGSLDIYDRLRPSEYAELRSQPGVTKISDLGPGLQTDHLGFNLSSVDSKGRAILDPVKRAWFNDTRFRQAVSGAIDRQTIASITLQGLATPLYGFVSPGNRSWAATNIPRATYDLERSRTILREGGFTTRGPQDRPELYDAKGNRVEFTLIVPAANQQRKDMAIVIQEDLSRLGIRMQVAPIDSIEFRRRTAESYDYEAALLVPAPSEPDPSTYTNFLSSRSPTNPWRPKQPRPATAWEARIDELLATQARETNPDRRRAVFHEIQRILAEQLPIIPIVARHVPVAANQRVGNHRPSAIPPFSFWNAEELYIRQP
jgi:peptide/nickel transport system substrate-binding protein